MNQFNERAATWDENPVHLQRSKAVLSHLTEVVALNRQMKVLEYGAGTGLLSFLMSDRVGHIDLIDTSAGMVAVVEQKIASSGVTNLTPRMMDLFKSDTTDTYDLIITQMVLHHVEKIDDLFDLFYAMSNPGGYLAIADLYPEDGSFHGPDFDGHTGFDPRELCQKLSRAGFEECSERECFVMKKTDLNGDDHFYPVFLIVARKKQVI